MRFMLVVLELLGLLWSLCVLRFITYRDRCFLLIGACTLIFAWLFFTDLGDLLGASRQYLHQEAPYRYVARSVLLLGIIWEWKHLKRHRCKRKKDLPSPPVSGTKSFV